MQIYLVGGAVRDQLLNLPVKERDWVVVGATVEEMLAQGYQPVGKDFPVFLHPETHEEYALARTERKNGRGYTGFVFHTSPDVSLEDDLRRRDLTINAIAQDTEGNIIDPFGGQNDLNERILRHVSDAFIEDPVRILRIARFAAKFARLGFQVAAPTKQLLTTMVRNGEVDALVKERVWQEFQRALQEPTPHAFFTVLQECGALDRLFPDIQVPDYLSVACALTFNPLLRFAIIFFENPNGLKSFNERYTIPKDYLELTNLVNNFYLPVNKALALPADEALALLEKVDMLRRPERFQNLLRTCEIIAKLRSGDNNLPFPQRLHLIKLAEIVKNTPTQPLVEQGLKGIELANELRSARIAAIKNYLTTLNQGN